MSQWEELGMDAKIAEILDVESHAPGHRFGRPFLTPYQIAISFKRRFPGEFETIGKPVGGKGTEQHHSLSQYIARELSRRIEARKITNIRGRFLHRANNIKLTYEGDGETVESSSGQSYDLSMYRLKDEACS